MTTGLLVAISSEYFVPLAATVTYESLEISVVLEELLRGQDK